MQAVMNNMALRKDQVAFVLKWLASIVQIFGYTVTALHLTPLNMYLFLVGIFGWLVVGLLWNDRAIILIHVIALAAMVFGLVNG